MSLDGTGSFRHFDKGWLRNLLDEIRTLKPDPRLDDWLFMASPWPTIYLTALYLILVKLIGPWFMANRRPYDLRHALVIYNGLQVLFSAWLFYLSVRVGWTFEYSLICQPVDYSYSANGIKAARSCWWYFISKFVEFVDTFFFVLRKKDGHVSFLHAFHHGMMPISTWLMVRYAPGGHTIFPGMMNTFVHIIMYFYYMVAAMGPRYQKYVWWKEYLTTLQIFQFVIVTIHSGQILFIDCNYPKSIALFFIVNAIIFILLFSNFYGQSYKNKQKRGDITPKNMSTHHHGHLDKNESPGHMDVVAGFDGLKKVK